MCYVKTNLETLGVSRPENHLSCTRLRTARLIKGHRHFRSSRCRRCFVRHHCCKRIDQEGIFENYNGFQEESDLEDHFHLHECFIRHIFPNRIFHCLGEGSIHCIRKGVKLQFDLLKLIASFYLCQIYVFAANWMIQSSVYRNEWLGLKDTVDRNCCNPARRLQMNKPCTMRSHVRFQRTRFDNFTDYTCKGSTTQLGVQSNLHRSSDDKTSDRHQQNVSPKQGRWAFHFSSLVVSVTRQVCFNPFNGVRVGEADNPGPLQSLVLDIGTFNPTQLLHKEDDILQWGQGI